MQAAGHTLPGSGRQEAPYQGGASLEQLQCRSSRSQALGSAALNSELVGRLHDRCSSRLTCPLLRNSSSSSHSHRDQQVIWHCGAQGTLLSLHARAIPYAHRSPIDKFSVAKAPLCSNWKGGQGETVFTQYLCLPQLPEASPNFLCIFLLDFPIFITLGPRSKLDSRPYTQISNQSCSIRQPYRALILPYLELVLPGVQWRQKPSS